MSRFTGSILLASILMVFTLHAGEITLHKDVESYDLSVTDNYHHFTRSPGPVYAPPGSPELPHIGHQVLLPPGEEISSVRMVNEVWETLPGQFHLYPAQAPVPYCHLGEQPFTEPDPSIYGSDGLYPNSPIEATHTGFMNGYSIGSVTITAARYQPASGILETLVSYDLEITTAGTPAAQEAFNTMLKQNARVIARVSSRVENQTRLDTYGAMDEIDLLGPKYLIVTTAEFVDALQMFIEQKTSRGLAAEIVLVDDIISSYSGIDTADKIRNCILDYYVNYFIEFVLMAGDVEHVPTRGLYAAIGGEVDEDIAADLYFSNLDGNWNQDGDNRWGEPAEADLYAEVAIGRFSADDFAEAYNMIYKTMLYENTPVTDDLETALMVGEDLGWVSWGGEYKDEVRLGSSNYGYTTAGFPANFNVDTLYDMYGTWSSMNDLLPRLNNGVHLVNHLGHCNTSWAMKFSGSQVNAFNMTNNGVDQNFNILYSQGCYCGSFDNRTTGGGYTSDAICENWTTIQSAAVAFVCNSRYGWGSGNNTNGASQYYDRQFFDALFDENITEIGWTNADSKEDNVPFISNATYWVYYELNILGDPSIDIWTGQPMSFSPTYPDTVILGTSQIDIDVGVTGVDISIMDDNEVIGLGLTGPTGSATVFLDDPITVPGQLMLVITAHNYIPFQGVIEAVAAEGPFVMMTDPYFDDTAGGNGDGNPDLGEVLTIGAEFENVGVENAVGLTATISIDENCVAILQNSTDLGDLMVGESISVAEAFEIELLPTVSDGQELVFVITVTDDQDNSWTSEYEIMAFAPHLELVTFSVEDGNDEHVMPGETATVDVEILNSGSGATFDLTISLLTDHPLANVTTESILEEPLLSGESVTIEDFELVIDETMTNPSALVLYVNAIDTRTYQDNFLFEIPIGGEFNDMEAGAGEWTHDVVTPGFQDQWNVAQIVNHTPGGVNAWYCGNGGQYMAFLDAGLVTPIYNIYGKHQLRVWHWISAEVSTQYPGYCYDGGIVEMSMNGGEFEQITPREGYPYLIRASSMPGALPQDTPCFSGQVMWQQVTFDIAGEGTVQFRFRFASDGATNNIGWFIDDFELIMESTPDAPTNLEASIEGTEATLTWNTPGIGDGSDSVGKAGPRKAEALEYYRIYRDLVLIDSVQALTYVDNLVSLTYGAYSYQVSGIFDGVEGSLSEPVTVEYLGIRTDDTASIPSTTALRSAYPNPFNPSINLTFDIASTEWVTMNVYDLMGRRVATLLDGQVGAGIHTLTWNADNHASGVYLVEMRAGSYTGLKKILFLK